MSNVIERARALRPIIEKAMAMQDDKTASEAAELYQSMKYDGSLIKVGTRINWGGVIKKSTGDTWDIEESNPDNAPTLWADLDYKNGVRIIPEVITVTTAFAKDELGWWQDNIYKSLVDNNVYTPEQYASNWEMQDKQ